MRMMYVAVLIALLSGSALANKQVEVNPAHVIDRNYKFARPMDCDWNASDLSKTMVYGYYDNGTPELFQVDLTLPTASAFGLDFLMEFTPAMMEHQGMPIKHIVIDYVPIPGKRCQTGFNMQMLSNPKR